MSISKIPDHDRSRRSKVKRSYDVFDRSVDLCDIRGFMRGYCSQGYRQPTGSSTASPTITSSCISDTGHSHLVALSNVKILCPKRAARQVGCAIRHRVDRIAVCCRSASSTVESESPLAVRFTAHTLHHRAHRRTVERAWECAEIHTRAVAPAAFPGLTRATLANLEQRRSGSSIRLFVDMVAGPSASTNPCSLVETYSPGVEP